MLHNWQQFRHHLTRTPSNEEDGAFHNRYYFRFFQIRFRKLGDRFHPPCSRLTHWNPLLLECAPFIAFLRHLRDCRYKLKCYAVFICFFIALELMGLWPGCAFWRFISGTVQFSPQLIRRIIPMDISPWYTWRMERWKSPVNRRYLHLIKQRVQ